MLLLFNFMFFNFLIFFLIDCFEYNPIEFVVCRVSSNIKIEQLMGRNGQTWSVKGFQALTSFT